MQDGSVLTAPPGIPVDIGPGATVAHMCTITRSARRGRGADRQSHCTVPRRCGDRGPQHDRCAFTGGRRHPHPDEVLVTGSPAKVKGPIAGTRPRSG